MRRWLYLVITVALCTGTLGCAFLRSLLSSFHEPTLSFERAELLDLNLDSATVNLHWALHNDNPISVAIARIAYSFAVEGHSLVSGKPPNGLHVNANGISHLAFPAHVEFRSLASTLEVFLTKPVAHYTASGSLGMDTPIGPLDIPLSYSGQFPVPKLPEIQPLQPVINSVDFTGAHLTFPLQVHNKNGFALPFNGLSGSLSLAGSNVAASNIGAMNALSSNETRVVNLGIDVNFLQAGLNVANAIRSHSVDLAYHGNLNVAGVNVPINIAQRFNLR